MEKVKLENTVDERETVIKIDHVSMKFNLNKEKVDNLKEYMIRLVKGKIEYEKFVALNDINLEVVEKLLHRKGMNVDTAKDGRDALTKYTSQEENYDIILMDIVMPVMDGLTAAKKIRSSGISGCEKIPIIAMTGNAMHENFNESKAAGMQAHLVKPLDADRLYEILLEYL